MTHITYATAKRLKEFCPELPEPMGHEYYAREYEGSSRQEIFYLSKDNIRTRIEFCGQQIFPAYQLHDLLSREFCEKMVKRQGIEELEKVGDLWQNNVWRLSQKLHCAYHLMGGLPAVEARLMRMMDGK